MFYDRAHDERADIAEVVALDQPAAAEQHPPRTEFDLVIELELGAVLGERLVGEIIEVDFDAADRVRQEQVESIELGERAIRGSKPPPSRRYAYAGRRSSVKL